MDSSVVIENAKLMWTPDPSRPTNMDAFRENVNEKFELTLGNYQELYKWSVDNYSEFWEECFHFLPIKYSKGWEQVVDLTKSIEDVPEWFQGCQMNFAESMLQYNDDRVAVYAAVEGREEVKKLTHRELRDRVALYAASMKKMGVKKGDRVVGYISNCIEAVEAMLAASSIGAIWSSTSPDFGVSGVLDRFTQIQPKLIFSVDSVVYNGRIHNHLDKLKHVVQGLPDLEKVVVIPSLTHGDNKPDISGIPNSCHLDDFLSHDDGLPVLEFEQLPFSHPLYIMYSSGTTGAPKCMVHSAGGTLLQQLKEHIIHGNLTRDDTIMYYTTTGWMMWNWLVAALAGGATLVLYDGSPLIPNANVLWDLVDKLGITILGTGAKWLAVLEDKGVKPIETHNLKSLHSILSTGSPLKPLTYEYVYRDIKKDLLLGSITGGTDIVSCFAGHNCSLPVYRGEIQARNLGMAVECWNEEGKPVYGESGELVCSRPFPCMPTYFWNDPDGIKYKNAYFNKFRGVWSHGDFCLINKATGGIWMLGRSDGTLNPNGVRFGSAELYHVVETFKEIQDSLCIAQRKKDLSEERVILFLKMAPGSQYTEDLVNSVKKDIRCQLSARHVPAVILETKDIPYTQSGKKVEVAVRKIISGEKITNRGAFSNPQSLDLYDGISELNDY